MELGCGKFYAEFCGIMRIGSIETKCGDFLRKEYGVFRVFPQLFPYSSRWNNTELYGAFLHLIPLISRF